MSILLVIAPALAALLYLLAWGRSVRATAAAGAGAETPAPGRAGPGDAGSLLMLAGLAARGETLIQRVYHLDRGYEAVEVKLRAVGAEHGRNRAGKNRQVKREALPVDVFHVELHAPLV